MIFRLFKMSYSECKVVDEKSRLEAHAIYVTAI